MAVVFDRANPNLTFREVAHIVNPNVDRQLISLIDGRLCPIVALAFLSRLGLDGR